MDHDSPFTVTGSAGRPRRLSRITAATASLAVLSMLAHPPAAHASARHATGRTARAAAACATDATAPKRQLRAMWITSVANTDWPSKPGLSVAAQQAEFRSWLDLAARRHMNAVFVQVRPTADAFWPSKYEPWSKWLTGTQGTAPGYDPLAFMVKEAHARNLELHAWFNPYRVSNDADPNHLAPNHPARKNPAWRFAYGGKLYYNPGVPAVRSFIEDAIMDAVTKYDIDGVHLDDYFYPYPVDGATLPDASTYARYGAGFASIADWRRANVDLLVRELGHRVHQAKPWARFGVSPFGIWRNSTSDPHGSRTSGLQSYDDVYADTRRWVKEGWVDYIAPQLYWQLGDASADYSVLADWWSDLVAGTGVELFIGQAVYRAGVPGEAPGWQRPDELTRHLTANRRYPEVAGDVYFSAADVRADRLGGVTRLVADHYARPALVPSHGGGTAPAAPTITSAERGPSGAALSWRPGDGGASVSYAVYRLDGTRAEGGCRFADARNLVGTTRGTSFTDTTAPASGTSTYYVTALNRTQHESPPSAGHPITNTVLAR
ncbi:glycoside hydrolase family 10 protein [Sphaerisporangium fuscum]|uniref:glycoside hydrolase family 10 protein n=1 Tax=Sphaerisporangium fuscum TaxID=2835868 RepID=UPI001BDCB1AB|nr:family 10 glycosylhydrolase [Sphaerisporangium fuscum]